MLAVGKPSVRPRRSPARPPRASGTARRGSARPRPPRRRHERADVARGDDLAVDLDERHDACLEPASAASIAGSPAARWPKRKFSPTETCVACRRSTSTWSMNSSGLCCAKPSSNGITTSSSTPSAAISSVFASRLVSSFGAASGRTTWQRVGLERQHGVAAARSPRDGRVDAVEFAHGHAPRARLDVAELRHPHRRGSLSTRARTAEPDHRLERARRRPARRASAIRPSPSTRRTVARHRLPCPGTPTP